MKENYENIKGFDVPWYTVSANRRVETLGVLNGEINADICIIGGGFTGISAALELVQRNYSVVLLESQTVGAGASGRNGGHVQRGYAKSPDWMIAHYGFDEAVMMSNLTFEGIDLIASRVRDHDISCDLTYGHLTAAITERHIGELKSEIESWKKIGHDDYEWTDKEQTRQLVRTDKYIAGIYDPRGAHFHPLNYLLGIADAAQKQGLKIYEQSAVTHITHGAQPVVHTATGRVKARFVIVAGAITLPQTSATMRNSITAEAHIIATAPLGQKRIDEIFGKNVAVIDANFIMNYYRLTADGRMLFGGNCNYNGKNNGDEARVLHQRMTEVFPVLRDVAIDYCWHGPLDLTANRMVDVGRLSDNVLYAHGFGGHGVVTTNILGKLLAEAVHGQAARFDVLSKISHLPLPGGDLFKRPLFQLGMAWYRLRDMLS